MPVIPCYSYMFDLPANPPTRARILFGDEFTQGIRYGTRRPHGSGDWLLIYTIAGSGHLRTGKGETVTKEGDAILYAPEDPQEYRTAPSPGQWTLRWIHFTPRAAWVPWLHWPVNREGIRLLHLPAGEIRDRFLAAFDQMLALFRRDLPAAMELAQNALEELILWARIAASNDPRLSIDPRIRKVLDHLSAHFREPFDLASIARLSGLSVSRFAHLFKEETGVTTRQFLELQRLQHAEQLLQMSSLSVAEIAYSVGFEDPFYFSNRFRLRTGRSPSEYRGAG